MNLNPALKKTRGRPAATKLETKSQPPTGYPLGMVLRACPDIADYARNGISGWGELVETANLVRGALGISPDAWNQACEAMGAVDAAIMVAAMLQKGEAISSPGGYLRSLTAKARGRRVLDRAGADGACCAAGEGPRPGPGEGAGRGIPPDRRKIPGIQDPCQAGARLR